MFDDAGHLSPDSTLKGKLEDLAMLFSIVQE